MVPQIKAVFGGGSFIMPWGSLTTDETRKEALSVLYSEGVKNLDTAREYGISEEVISKLPNHEIFTIDTKIKGGLDPGSATRNAVLRDVVDSLEKCKVESFDVLYIHAPDPTVPIADTLEGINDAYQKGAFKRFGLSNFTAEQVQEVYDAAKAKGYILPSVYQGNYSPIARHLETLLFPTLRKLGFSFYAYSPLAGGFLTKTAQQLDDGDGRWNPQIVGSPYSEMYDKPVLRAVLAEWNDVAEKEGISTAELSYRWVGYNSILRAELGDAVIFGAPSVQQIKQTAQGLKKGGLSDSAKSRIEAIWQSVKNEAPVDNWEQYRGENGRDVSHFA